MVRISLQNLANGCPGSGNMYIATRRIFFFQKETMAFLEGDPELQK